MKSLTAAVLIAVLTSTASLAGDATTPGGTFVDDDGSAHEGAIEAIADREITLGCDLVGPRYCPDAPVTRAQMASFLVAAFDIVDSPVDGFVDDDGSVHEPAINALLAGGITFGCGADPAVFCPSDPVTRAQMAAFIARAMELVPPVANTFTDDDGSGFESDIEAIAAAGITAGCSAADPALYCPSDPVTRAQMASFLARALDLTLLVPPPRPSPGERLVSDHGMFMTFGVREAGTAAEADALDWLAEQLEQITGHVSREEVPLVNGRTSGNVWTTIGAGSRSILLGAHVDSYPGSLGADDNGSGVTVLLEAARNLVADPPPGVSVTIAFFGAEERLAGFSADTHHAGSRLRADELADAGDLPDWMVSVDMVGVGVALNAVTYLSTSGAAADHLVAAAASVDVAATRVSRGDISDHEAFALLGVPSVFMWRPDNPHWHQPTDTVVDFDLLAEDLAVVRAFVDRVGG